MFEFLGASLWLVMYMLILVMILVGFRCHCTIYYQSNKLCCDSYIEMTSEAWLYDEWLPENVLSGIG